MKKQFPILSLLIILFTFCMSYPSFSQYGTLKGSVLDKNSGKFVPFVMVSLEQKFDVIAGTVSDADGNFILKPLDPGYYSLKVSYVGYKTLIVDSLLIKPDQIVFYDPEIEPSVEMLEEVVVTSYHIPLIDRDATLSGGSVSASSIKKMAGKSSKHKTRTHSSRAESDFAIDCVTISDEKDLNLSSNKYYKPGQLTAGEINDFSKWKLWKDISENALSEYRESWGIIPEKRYCVQVMNENGFPVVGGRVLLLDTQNNPVRSAVTDNTGKAELWPGLFLSDSMYHSKFGIRVEHKGIIKQIKKPKEFSKGINTVTLTTGCEVSNKVDILFTVDATGSMGDEIEYLKSELQDIIEKFSSQHADLAIRLGAVFYRDRGDAYVTKKSELSDNIGQPCDFIKRQSAGGGGDFPEAVDDALEMSVNDIAWAADARAKIMFLVLDAPPHSHPENLEKVRRTVSIAAEKGIRIIPVTASGIDKSTEYLMRAIALATNGTYVFLTDDSGIGGKHIKPTIDDYKVELLNQLILRLLEQYTFVETCIQPEADIVIDSAGVVVDSINTPVNPDGKFDPGFPGSGKANRWIRAFPNPTTGPVTIDHNRKIEEIFVVDISGKILMRLAGEEQKKIRIDLGNFPNGLYFFRFADVDHWEYAKIVVQR